MEKTMKNIYLVAMAMMVSACGIQNTDSDTSEKNIIKRGEVGAKADRVINKNLSCVGACGSLVSEISGYCGCDEECADWGDCCNNKAAACDATVPTCGDGMCDVTVGESPESCPADCDAKACSVDSDCVAVQTTCCSCSMGGEEQAYHVDFADQFAAKDCLPGLMCLAYFNCFGGPACVDGQCQMVEQPQPKTCGPYPGGECGDGEMCDMNSCGVGGSGVCAPVPEACKEMYEPVCGCDGQTYSSQCHRQVAGVALDFEGECESETVSCDSSQAYCMLWVSPCPAGQVREVSSFCWGECVDITACSCELTGPATQCPLEGYTCHGTTNTCGPYVF